MPLSETQIALAKRLVHSPCFKHLRGHVLYELHQRHEPTIGEIIKSIVWRWGAACRVCGGAAWGMFPQDEYNLDPDQVLCDKCWRSLLRFQAPNLDKPAAFNAWLADVVHRRPERLFDTPFSPTSKPRLLDDEKQWDLDEKSKKRHREKLADRRWRFHKRLVLTVARHYKLTGDPVELLRESTAFGSDRDDNRDLSFSLTLIRAYLPGRAGVKRGLAAVAPLLRLRLIKKIGDGEMAKYYPTAKIWEVYQKHRRKAYENHEVTRLLIDRLYQPLDELARVYITHQVHSIENGWRSNHQCWLIAARQRSGLASRREFDDRYDLDEWLKQIRRANPRVKIIRREMEIRPKPIRHHRLLQDRAMKAIAPKLP